MSSHSGSTGRDCLFCFEECRQDTPDAVKLCTNHNVFVHNKCLTCWLAIKNECPLCRERLTPIYGYTAIEDTTPLLIHHDHSPPPQPQYSSNCTARTLFGVCVYVFVGLIIIGIYVVSHA